MILIELTAAVSSDGSTRTFYVSDKPFITKLGDTPPNLAFIPAVLEAGDLGVSIFNENLNGGGTRLESGEIVLANIDGQFDDWRSYSFAGRPIRIYAGEGGAYPADFQLVFTGTCDTINASRRNLIIRLRDKQLIFDVPVLTRRYKGTNAGPIGLEGESNLAGRPVPRVFGKVLNITPMLANYSKQVYQVNNGRVQDIPAVYVRGASVTKGADYGDNSALLAAAPAAGTYITCFAEGYFRLGSAPDGLVTADVTEGSTAADRTAAQILKRLAILAGATAA